MTRLSRLQLDALAAGRTPTTDERAILAAEPTERARLDAIRAENDAIRALPAFALERDRLPVLVSRRRSRRMRLAVIALAPALAVVAIWVRGVPDEVRAKGTASVTLVSEDGVAIRPPLRRGQRVRLRVDSAGAPYVAVLVEEAESVRSVLFAGPASEATGGLPAFEVTRGDFTLLVVHATERVDTAELLRAIESRVPGEAARARVRFEVIE